MQTVGGTKTFGHLSSWYSRTNPAKIRILIFSLGALTSSLSLSLSCIIIFTINVTAASDATPPPLAYGRRRSDGYGSAYQ